MKDLKKLSLAALILFLVPSGILFAQAQQIESQKSHQPRTLPIFRLSAPEVSETAVTGLATDLLRASGRVSRKEGRLSLRSGSKLVEVFTASGGIWAADEASMWNPQLKPDLPDEKRARALAEKFFEQHKLLLPESKDQLYSVSFSNLGGTYAAFVDARDKQRTNRRLDIQVNYSTRINLARTGGESVPVVGGGSEFNVTFGDRGQVIGYQGTSRQIAGVAKESPVIPKEKADEQFRYLTRGMKIRSSESYLAYYSAPPSVKQDYMYPVYVYRAVAQVEDQTVPLRLITLPATEFGPRRPEQRALPRRSEKNRPTRRSTMPEGPEERGTPEPKDKTEGGHLAPARSNVTGILPASFTSSESILSPPTYLFMQPTSWREAGTSWIGLSGGLGGSQNNAQGFVNELSADGWSINFNWGDANAWESDWRRNNKQWVDAADFVFYTGHANMNGWVLRSPEDGFLDFNEVGAGAETPGDMWGREDLEWVIIAACGPLQDDVISPGGGDVFARWDGAFDGLHQLLGYGAITFDNEEEGKSVARYAKEGETVINAWFRAAREIQPSNNGAGAPDGPLIWVGVMYVGRSGITDPANDHIWLHGAVAPDPTSPTYYVAMWTTT